MSAEDIGYSDSSTPPPGDTEGEPAEADNSALLPKSILAGKDCKVGGTVTLRIDAIHGEEIEVSPVGESTDEGETSAMDQAKSGLDSYAKTPEQM